MPPAPKLIAALVLMAGLAPFGQVAIAAAGPGSGSGPGPAAGPMASAPSADPDAVAVALPDSEATAPGALSAQPPAAGAGGADPDGKGAAAEPVPAVPGTPGAGTTATPAQPEPTAPPTTTTAAAEVAATRPRSAMPEGDGFDRSAEDAFLAATNGSRAAAGVASLAWDHELSAYARRHARFLAIDGNLAHSNISVLLDGWSTVGENVGAGPSVSAIHAALVASPDHYRNLADPLFANVGIGVYVDAGGRTWTAHVFGV